MLVQILIKTTSSVDMTNGFDMILKPLTYLKINTSSISLIFALVLRFIPNLISEAKTIYLAQKSKGVLNHKNKFFAKIKAYSTTYRSFGAGVQTSLDEGQTMTYDDNGNMVITGFDITYDPLRYIVGTVSDHILYINDSETSLRTLCGRNAKIVFEIVTPFEILTKGLL
jgi:hypothetical protein